MKRELNENDLRNLTQEQAEEIFAQGREAVIWALLKLSVLADKKKKTSPSTPSSQVPPYEKPATKKKRKKRGRKKGHKGACRKPPPEIDRREEHTLDSCPDCGGALGDSYAQRQRVIEDIEQSTVVTTEHTIHSHYCPCCKKRVEPRVTDALPKSTIGNRALVLSSWLHYGQGQTISQIVSVFDSLFHFRVTPGGLVGQWRRLEEILKPWYEAIAAEAQSSAVLNADETGWRVNGKTHWLWCFTNPRLSYYLIDPSRSSAVPREFLAESFEGTLVCDFYGAYNKLSVGRWQRCLVHLLGELKKVEKKNKSPEWSAFQKRLKRLLKDSIRLSRRTDREAADYASKRERIAARLDELVARLPELKDADCQRLTKRLRRHRDELFTFLDNPDVPFDNNRAEREIRPAVIARKNSFQNASERGAQTQAVMMTVYRTLKLRGLDLIATIGDALNKYIATGKLPALPRGPD